MGEDGLDAEVRGEIAEAVGAALAKHGYARLTTKQVAEESELSEAGLFYHCDTKDEMIAVFLDAARRQRAAEFEAIANCGPEERLRAASELLLVDADDERARGVNVAVMELMAHAPHNDALQEPLLALTSTTLDELEAIIAAGIDEGVFREVDPRGAAGFIKSAADGWTGFSIALGVEGMDERLRTQMDLFVDSLLRAE